MRGSMGILVQFMHGRLKGQNLIEELHIAAFEGDTDEAIRLIDRKGVAVDAELQHPMSASILTTPLFVAIQEGNSDTAKALVARGANINRTNDSGYTPLMRASTDDPAMVKILLELGADPNFYRPGDGANALSFAAHCEDKENAAQTVRLLIEAGADVEMPSDEEQSVLMLAARANLPEVAKLLLEAGADPDRTCRLKWALGWTALDHAINEHGTEVEAVLRTVTTRPVIATPGLV